MELLESHQNTFIFLISFTIIVLASQRVGRFFVRIKLPLISGFLFLGIVAGPFGLHLIPAEAIPRLRFVDQISLAFIAFAAGGELYLKELRSRFKSITWVTGGLVFTTFTLGAIALYLLSDYVPFMSSMPAANRVAISLLAAAILVARSPSSAIAIVNELRAKGPFTQMVMGVTVIMDVVVIVLFALNSSIADAVLTEVGFDITFLLLLFSELVIELVLGIGLLYLLRYILSHRLSRAVKTGLVLLAGYGIYIISATIRQASHDILSLELLLEPLLICMIGSFLVTNYTPYRAEFLKILHDVGPAIYVAFFTLTGASLALDILARTWPIALALFVVRLVAISIGSFTGGVLAGDPMKYNRIGWMAYITQAGVGLGLAKEVAVEFPEWGGAFATTIISIIVLNQVIGPPFFKWAINLAGEAHLRGQSWDTDGSREAIIFGLEGQSLTLARRLRAHGWQVKIASRRAVRRQEIPNSDIEIESISDLTLDTMRQIKAGQAETIVTMLSDEENYRVCELAYEHFGTEHLVVRLNERANLERFHELGALIVDPNTAIVNLLDEFVRSPTATSLLLGLDSGQEFMEIEVRDPTLHGLALRDLNLPLDVLVLSVRRRNHVLISHGYSCLERGDWVTVVGPVESLEQVALRFGL